VLVLAITARVLMHFNIVLSVRRTLPTGWLALSVVVVSTVVCLSLHWVPAHLAYLVGSVRRIGRVPFHFPALLLLCGLRLSSVARLFLAIRGVALRLCHCKHRVAVLHLPRHGGSLSAVRIMRVLMCGAGAVFAVVLVPVLPVLAAMELTGRVAGSSMARCGVPAIPGSGHGVQRSASTNGFTLRTEDGGRRPDESWSATSADAAAVGVVRTGVERGWLAAAHGSPSPQSARVDSWCPGEVSSGPEAPKRFQKLVPPLWGGHEGGTGGHSTIRVLIFYSIYFLAHS